MCICVYIRAYVRAAAHLCVQTRICAYIYVNTRTYIDMCIFAYIWVHTRIYVYIRLYMIYTCVAASMHVHPRVYTLYICTPTYKRQDIHIQAQTCIGALMCICMLIRPYVRTAAYLCVHTRICAYIYGYVYIRDFMGTYADIRIYTLIYDIYVRCWILHVHPRVYTYILWKAELFTKIS